MHGCSLSLFIHRASCSVSYDFIYVGAGCSPQDAQFFAQFLSVDSGVLIAPVAQAQGANLRSHLCLYACRKSVIVKEELLAVMFQGLKQW